MRTQRWGLAAILLSCGCSATHVDTNSLEGFVQLATLGSVSGPLGQVTVTVADANAFSRDPNVTPLNQRSVSLDACLSVGGCAWTVPALGADTFQDGLVGSVVGDANWLTSYTLTASGPQFAASAQGKVPFSPAFAFAVPQAILPIVAQLTGTPAAHLLSNGFGLGLVRQYTAAGANQRTPTPAQGISVSPSNPTWKVYYPTLDASALAGTPETTSSGVFLVVPQDPNSAAQPSTWILSDTAHTQSPNDVGVPAVGLIPGAVSVFALDYQ